jgi:hypothetical protein
MATIISTGNLYAEIGRLAYTTAKFASAPLHPFTRADIGPLIAQSATLSHLALTLYRCNPTTLAQLAVDRAVTHLNAARSLFDIVHLRSNNMLNAPFVLRVANTAVAAIEAVWADTRPDQTAQAEPVGGNALSLST